MLQCCMDKRTPVVHDARAVCVSCDILAYCIVWVMLVVYNSLKWPFQDSKEPIQLEYMPESPVVLPSDCHVKC